MVNVRLCEKARIAFIFADGKTDITATITRI